MVRNSAPELTIRKQVDSHNLWVILLQIVTMGSLIVVYLSATGASIVMQTISVTGRYT